MTDTEKHYPNVVIVNEQDEVIGAEQLFTAIKNGQIKRAARVYVFNAEGKVLLQRRSKHVLKPLLLCESAAGHVDEGEEYHEAAVRELQEELGLSDHPLTEVVSSHRNGEFFESIYKTAVADEADVTFAREEIEEVLWRTPEEVDELIARHAEECTEEFVRGWTTFRDELTV